MNNLSLYEITSGFPALMENEEISEEDKKKIEDELVILLQQKSQNIIGYTKNIELTINAMKEEEKRIADNRKALENKMAKFKDYVKECMEKNGITKMDFQNWAYQKYRQLQEMHITCRSWYRLAKEDERLNRTMEGI